MKNEKNSKIRIEGEFMNEKLELTEEQIQILQERLPIIIRQMGENFECYLCKNKIQNKRFTKSHSIPKFILKYIASVNEYQKECYEVKTLYNEQNIEDTPRTETINTAGIFENVCINCENILFKNYEKFLEDYEKFLNDENKNIPDDDILSEINLKIYLKEIYELKKAFFQGSELDTVIEKIKEDEAIKRNINEEIIDKIIDEDSIPKSELYDFQKKKWEYLTEKLDKTVEKNLKICDQKIKSKSNSKNKKLLDYLRKRKIILSKYKRKNIDYTNFSYIFHIIDLKYRVPLTIQCVLDLQEMITIMKVLDLDTHRIIKSTKDRESFIPVSVCIFPLENTTRIFLFSENDNKIFNIFKQEFENVEQDIQLKFINYMVIKTTNTYCYSPLIDSLTEDKIKKIIINNEDGRLNSDEIDKLRIKKEIEETPNLLSEKYSIKELNLIIKFIKGSFILEMRNVKAIINCKNLKLRKIGEKEPNTIEKLFLNYNDKYKKIDLDWDNEVGKEIWYNDESEESK